MDIELDRRDSTTAARQASGRHGQFVKHDADKPDMRLLPMLAVKAMAAESHLVSDHYGDFVSVAVDELISTRSIRPVDRYVRAMACPVTLESDLVGHTTGTTASCPHAPRHGPGPDARRQKYSPTTGAASSPSSGTDT